MFRVIKKKNQIIRFKEDKEDKKLEECVALKYKCKIYFKEKGVWPKVSDKSVED